MVELGEALDEVAEQRVGGEHEGGDEDPLAAAEVGLVEGAVDDLQVEAEGVLVELPPSVMAEGLPSVIMKICLLGCFWRASRPRASCSASRVLVWYGPAWT